MATWYVATTGSDSNAGTSSGAPYLTIGKALLSAASGDQINVKAGTYVVTATMTITQATMTIQGYQTTPGDGGTKPLITTATNSVNLFSCSSNGGVQVWDNISLSHTAGTRANGIWQSATHGTTQFWVFLGCVLDGFTVAINSDNNVGADVSNIIIVNTEIKNCTVTGTTNASAVNSNTGKVYISGCYFHSSTGSAYHVLSGSGVTITQLIDTILAAGVGGGIRANGELLVDHCDIANNTLIGISFVGGTLKVDNSIVYGQGTNGISNSAGNAVGVRISRNNAFGANTSGNSSWAGSPGDVALSADPFTSSAAGDYSLNATTGGGTACKGAGFPGVFPGGLSTGGPDIGAVQTVAVAASGGGSYTFAG
jgi:hypothetical protein